jgi:ribosome maturation factor RimP
MQSIKLTTGNLFRVASGVFVIANKYEKIIEEIVKPIIEGSGYEYVGVELSNAGGSKELVVYADKPGGINLDDCESISRLIEPAIDAKDPIDDAYYLCVSSPGLDRALKEPPDFQRSIGKDVDIKLYRAKDGNKEFTGELKSYDDNGFTIETNGSLETYTYKEAAIVKLHVDI